MKRIALFLSLAVLALGSVAPVFGVELFGRPLRGLSPVSIAAVVKDPSLFSSRIIGIRGKARPAGPGKMTVEEAGASIHLETDGSFSVPEKASGDIRAEGRVQAEGKGSPRFIASGVEFSR